MTSRPTDEAGGVTDEELDALIDELIEIRRPEFLGGIPNHIEVSRARLRRFALERLARGVELATWLMEKQSHHLLGTVETAAELRALAERIREGQL